MQFASIYLHLLAEKRRRMSGMSVVAGPDVDMAELEGGLLAGNVDLDLNLGPPAFERDGLSLGLGLGQGLNDLEAASQVSRHNWPRFEPGMSGLFSVANQDIEPFPGLDTPHHVAAVNSSSVGSTDQLTDPLDRGRLQISPQETRSPVLSDPERQLNNGGDHGRQSHPPHSQTRHRSRRISRQLLRSRHTLDRPDTQSALQFASPAESTSALHFVDAEEFTPSLVVFGTLDRRRDSDAPRNCLHRSMVTPHRSMVTPKESTPKLNVQEVKETEGGSSQANFDCNICLDLAKEPVVTTCGHLFCWPCLYQWLHVHSHEKECPVCKGHVTDDAITPIYGRGNAQDIPKTSGEQRTTEPPPRPHAHRIENSRRWQRRGTSEGQRLVRDAEGTSRDGRMEGQRHTGRMPGGLSSGVGRSAEQILHRLRIAQRLQREHLEQRFMARHRLLLRSPSVESRTGDTTIGLEDVQVGVSEVQLYDDREQILAQMAIDRLQSADRLAVIRARLVASMDGLLENLSNVRRSTLESGNSGPGHTGVSGGLGREGVVTGQDVREVAEPVVGGDRTSTSGTVLVDIANGDVQLDPSLTQSTQQRQAHEALGGASSSSDVDPGLLHARKRRRLN